MSKSNFQVRISPSEAFALVRDQQKADLVHEELHELGEGKYLGTLIFEKYYMRTKNRAALIVLIDNLQGVTDVRSIATGSSEGMFFNFDWGAADNFVNSVSDILQDFIIGN
ncbi:hypothetical protein D7Z26_01565 [Cohnella endophytica]|uniref:Uncharacterized protein n=1 Tax=Cohnella endophytica TaxID=2419778 RepID=A0A494Y8C9_9BACL|nr:DUF6054 family protein [Cohnella endophytica]RKP58343.1 hypothetical protein D7Z26_01565 [Cohnella endophytica]